MSEYLLTLNAGSSSVKFSLFDTADKEIELVTSGEVECLGHDACFRVDKTGCGIESRQLGYTDHAGAISYVINWINVTFHVARVVAIGHRIVHGGLKYTQPVLINSDVFAYLKGLEPLAPLHQPHNLTGVSAARAAFPSLPQVACFDTAFHHGRAFNEEAFALPTSFYDRGIRRFGFHGLSYEYILCRLSEIKPEAASGRVIIAHLGAGASLCALLGGRSIATTMGFSALEGLPMGSRSGSLDPGLLLYLIEHDKLSTPQLSHLLYHQSGLLGLSGLSSDMRKLEASQDLAAQRAVDYFIHCVKKQVAAMAATINGLDTLIFTGGIGVHSAFVRAGVIAGLDWMGLYLNSNANQRGELCISSVESSISAFVIETDEQTMIARHTLEAINLR